MVAVIVCKECLLGNHEGCIERDKAIIKARRKLKVDERVGGQYCICECGEGHTAKDGNRAWYDHVMEYSRKAFLP